MGNLPLELIQLIVDSIPESVDVRRLRLVSRKFKAIITPRAFRVLHVTVYEDSVNHMNFIQDHDELRHHVQEVVFQYEDEEIESVADSVTRAAKVKVVENGDQFEREFWDAELDEEELSEGEDDLEGDGEDIIDTSSEGLPDGEGEDVAERSEVDDLDGAEEGVNGGESSENGSEGSDADGPEFITIALGHDAGDFYFRLR